ncbi:MAG TPA: tRNA glutamyl-Q(34) synthetase GluQRS [Thiobacillaceae bacterium]|nr:tRNA glutamyl-Q(34) synthetase GluQRS [Thiobacillaceae bacterium]
MRTNNNRVNSSPVPYVGRFAPSPTGPLHFGSLVAAVGSYLDARARSGQWLLRMEDVDEPRCSQVHADEILRALEILGFEWDGAVLYQSRRKAHYRAALDRLVESGDAYACACTRKEIVDSSLKGIEGPLYPGTCREGLKGRAARAWRVQVDEAPVCFDDRLQGRHCQRLANDVGDFVVRRADGYFAYQLAVVVDDATQCVTHVVRGADLLVSTPRQIYLQRLLGFSTPEYLHLPVVLNQAGQKLSKQTLAPALEARNASRDLFAALSFLGQEPPSMLRVAPVAEILQWATGVWRGNFSLSRASSKPSA